MSRTIVSVCALWLIVVAGAGCSNSSGEPGASQAPSTPSSPATSAVERQQVTRVVFVGKQNPCECTRKAIDASWTALTAALGPHHQIPVEEMKIDTEPDRVAPYQAKRTFIALPAIYFLDASDRVVEMLQGDVTEAQVSAVLQ